MSGSESGTRKRPLWISQLRTDQLHSGRIMHGHNHFKVMQTNSSYYHHHHHHQIITYTLTQTHGHRLVRCRAFATTLQHMKRVNKFFAKENSTTLYIYAHRSNNNFCRICGDGTVSKLSELKAAPRSGAALCIHARGVAPHTATILKSARRQRSVYSSRVCVDNVDPHSGRKLGSDGCEPVADSAVGLLAAEIGVDESLLDRGKQEVYHAVGESLGTAVVGAEGLSERGQTRP